LTAHGRALALPFGSLLVAGPDALDLVHPADTDSGFSVDSVPVKLGCEKPALARLPNGRVLVVGKDALYELDPRSADLSAPVKTRHPRCSATVVIHPEGGALLLGGTDGSSGAASSAPELYDSPARSTSNFDLTSSVSEDWLVSYWFDLPTLWRPPSDPQPAPRFDLDWQSRSLRVDEILTQSSPSTALRLLPDGSFLVIAEDSAARFRRGPLPGATPFSFRSAPTLHMRSEMDFDDAFPGAAYPGSAPEGSTGATANSPTNLPVPVWFPTEGCCAATGTVTRTGANAIFRVPPTAFPGEGLLFLSTNGELTGFGPAVISASDNGAECRDAGECESGICVDGVCCESGCDGVCESCSGTETGEQDGLCRPVQRGKVDVRCTVEEVATCGQDGTCDGARACAAYPDGTACVEGGECTAGKCKFVTGPGDGSAGEAGSSSGGGAGRGDADQAPKCTDDDQLKQKDGETKPCAPYRCRIDRCAEPCASNRDCIGGNVCTAARTCEPPHNVTRTIGCGCHLIGSSRTPLPWWSTILLSSMTLLGTLRRRRRPSTQPGRAAA
jgi:hypothetical protein